MNQGSNASELVALPNVDAFTTTLFNNTPVACKRAAILLTDRLSRTAANITTIKPCVANRAHNRQNSATRHESAKPAIRRDHSHPLISTTWQCLCYTAQSGKE
jgi:hypothetical protein